MLLLVMSMETALVPDGPSGIFHIPWLGRVSLADFGRNR
jgi:hypothetical protein